MSTVPGWKYYNHAAVPTTPPHENLDLTPIKEGTIWKDMEKSPLLARWTTDFDCGYETNWWYVIKDTPIEIMSLKAKHRYKINKGTKSFLVREIDPMEYTDELYEVFAEAFQSWPKKYRPTFTLRDAQGLAQNLSANPHMICYGAFYRENEELCGFMQVPAYENHIELQVLRVKPAYEKYEINAAMVYHVLRENKERLEQGSFYVLDGARNINHETAFQDYLEQYFGFRKAYCKLNVAYKSWVKRAVNTFYPFRKLLLRFDQIGIVHQINTVLKMEEICRSEVLK